MEEQIYETYDPIQWREERITLFSSSGSTSDNREWEGCLGITAGTFSKPRRPIRSCSIADASWWQRKHAPSLRFLPTLPAFVRAPVEQFRWPLAPSFAL